MFDTVQRPDQNVGTAPVRECSSPLAVGDNQGRSGQASQWGQGRKGAPTLHQTFGKVDEIRVSWFDSFSLVSSPFLLSFSATNLFK